MSIPKQIWIAFFPTFGIVLAIVLFLFQARVDFLSLSAKYVAINTIFAIIIAFGATIPLLTVPALCAGFLGRVLRRLLVRVTLYTLGRAASGYAKAVTIVGMDHQRGNAIIRLATGSIEAIAPGNRFEVLNTASRRKLGVLEVEAVEETSCVCRVFDRIDVDFWAELEGRIRTDPSPPSGVTVSREVPEGLLIEEVIQLVKQWGG